MKGKELRRFRAERDWTLDQMAEELRVNKSSLSRWENERYPIPGYIEKLIELLKREVTAQ